MRNRPLAGTYHYGIDLPAPEGASVRAIAPGRIIRVQRKGPGGLEMLIQHDRFVAVYSHLGRVAPVVAEGHFTVKRGETVGTVGRSGLTYGMHLYFGILVDGKPIDPAPVLAVAPCHSSNAATGPATEGRISPSRGYSSR
jgi:murein DD-endopeptidase MepM/ murein hydrolase activator NlpD